MMRRRTTMKYVLLAVVLPISGHADAQSPQPYAGLQSRPLKALLDAQIADLRAGRGMTLALAAELNGYPGPLHVIELADALATRNSAAMRTPCLVSNTILECTSRDMSGFRSPPSVRIIRERTSTAGTLQVKSNSFTLSGPGISRHVSCVPVAFIHSHFAPSDATIRTPDEHAAVSA